MHILDQIIARKKEEVATQKALVSEAMLKQMPFFKVDALSMSSFVTSPLKTGIIAEFKRKSPSKGIINNTATVTAVTAAYSSFGASGLSVLTDLDFLAALYKTLQLRGFMIRLFYEKISWLNRIKLLKQRLMVLM